MRLAEDYNTYVILLLIRSPRGVFPPFFYVTYHTMLLNTKLIVVHTLHFTLHTLSLFYLAKHRDLTKPLLACHSSKDLKCVIRRPSSVVVVRRPSSVVVVVVRRCLYLLSSHISTLVYRISTFYCTYVSFYNIMLSRKNSTSTFK